MGTASSVSPSLVSASRRRASARTVSEWDTPPPQSPGRCRQLPVACRSTAAERIIEFLRRTHPLKTAENVAADTGLGAETVQTWIDRGSAPNVVGLWALVSAYGPDFLCAALGDASPSWLCSAARDAELQRIEAQMQALAAKAESLKTIR